MTIVPQQYTLHCVSTGTIPTESYSITFYYDDNQQISHSNCANCVRQLLHSSNGTYDHTVTVTWDTQTISSGSFSQSVNGDQLYRCNVQPNNKNHDLTVKGIYLFLHIFNIYILSSRIYSISSY